MYSQTELDNYKLQVGLLEEKLKQSEDYRHHLERKLEQILKKRNEHDKSARAKARQRYQQLLDEQEKCKERNRLLLKMLERIDEQSAVMSARSERLKMLKLQYEMHFAKVVQNQTMHCIQQNAVAAASIPVFLPSTTPRAPVTATPSRRAEDATAKLSTSHQSESNVTSMSYSDNPKQVTNSSTNTPLTALAPLAPHHWTLALPPATPACVLLTSTPTRSDYIEYPIGYLPTPMHFAYQQHSAASIPQPTTEARPSKLTADVADALSPDRRNSSSNDGANGCDANSQHPRTLNKFADSKNDPKRFVSSETTKSSTAASTKSSNLLEPIEIAASRQKPPSTAPPTTKTPFVLSTRISAPSAPPTSSSSETEPSTSMTFDKLPAYNGKSKTLLHQSAVNATEDVATAEGTSAAPAAETPEAAARVSFGKTTTDALLNPRSFPKTNIIDDKKTLNSQSLKVSDVKKHSDVGSGANADAASDGNADTLADAEETDDANSSRRQEINDARKATVTMTPTTVVPIDPHMDSYAAGNPSVEINSNSFDNLARTTATPTMTAADGSPQLPKFERKKKMSIENIENIFYGEVVQPTSMEGTRAALEATSELLEEFANVTPMMQGPAATMVPSAVSSKVVQQPLGEEMKSSKLLSEIIQEKHDYNPSEAEPSLASSEDADVKQPSAVYDASPNEEYETTATEAPPGDAQEYDPNFDYQSYDTTGYQGAYGSEEYPGYTYDESTGQYTANEDTQQYNDEYSYMQQEYEASQQQQLQSEEANYEFSQYQEEASPAQTIKEHDEVAEDPASKSLLQPNTEPQTPPVASPATIQHPPAIKPILTTEKTAANDAQQNRKKKRVNFVDSSETDDSSSAKLGGGAAGAAGSSESDFDFSASVGPTNN